MYLSKLELHGFKSFAERTSLQFDSGVTAVVGPNGCGKSNIVDAVRWVVGEQRARILRSDKMESVIFNGTAKKRPLGMAEVTLTIENNRGVLPVEYDEISIGRRLFRSGESEYVLNGVQCRLKDITDLFMDTGMGAGAYSVIELKMIEEILSDNEQDRRRLFEEAAGITRYKSRRAQAMRKLDNTQADLTRLRDLVDEIDKRVRSLQRQASKATRYKEVSTRLRRLELSLSRVEFDRLSDQRGSLERDIADLRLQLEAQIARHGESEAALESMKVALLEREESYACAQAALREHVDSVQALDAELRLRAERIESGHRELERTRREQADAEARVFELQEETASLELARYELEPDVADADEKLARASERRDSAQTSADEARGELARLREATQDVSDGVAERLRQLDRQSSRVEILDADLTEGSERHRRLEQSVGATREMVLEDSEVADSHGLLVTDAQGGLEQALERETEAIRGRDEHRQAVQEIERRAEATAAEMQLLQSLVSSYEDASDAVQFLAEEREWSSNGFVTPADVIDCDAEYAAAVEAALAAYLDCIIVRSEGELERAVAKLRASDKGRATFIVLDRLPASPRPDYELVEGAVPLERLVRVADPRFENLVGILLRNAFVVDNLTPPNGGSGLRFFTRSGEWVDGGGAVHAGSTSRPTARSSRLGRREQLSRASEEYESLLGTLNAAREQAREVDARVSESKSAVRFARQELTSREHEAVEADKRLARRRFELHSGEHQLAELATRLSTTRATIESLRGEISSLNKTVESDLQILADLKGKVSVAEDIFHSAESDSRVALAQFSEINVAAVELHNQLDNLRRDQERNTQAREDLAHQIDERKRHITNVEATISASEEERSNFRAKLESLRSQRESLERAVDEAKSELLDSRTEISDIENSLREIRRLRDEHQRLENQRVVKLTEVQTRVEDLVRHIEEDYSVSIESVRVETGAIADESDARREVVELRRQVRNMGPINELALEEYEAEQTRLDFLTKQLADLTEAEKTLLQTIDEINATASNRFMETFAAVQANFSSLFTELFGADTAAEVILEDPGDPLESAIDVMARPRGKRPSVLAQLSGGEKTLTAIALLFAIYLVKPSPFCILDEVDAPLDDANIGRFMKIIRQFSNTTQFILVTHNKRTMQAADRMYGVTMQEQGVSSLVGVKFEDVREVQEADA